jgi:large subunit ribosomal protein L21
MRDVAAGSAWAVRRLRYTHRLRVILGQNLLSELRNQSSQRANMYAVIKTGGKQYKVAAGDRLKVEQMTADVGQEVVLDQVLAVGEGADLKTGSPLIAGASVTAKVVAQGLHPKVRIFKMRRRKHYQRHGGHRQAYTELEIGAVTA